MVEIVSLAFFHLSVSESKKGSGSDNDSGGKVHGTIHNSDAKNGGSKVQVGVDSSGSAGVDLVTGHEVHLSGASFESGEDRFGIVHGTLGNAVVLSGAILVTLLEENGCVNLRFRVPNLVGITSDLVAGNSILVFSNELIVVCIVGVPLVIEEVSLTKEILDLSGTNGLSNNRESSGVLVALLVLNHEFFVLSSDSQHTGASETLKVGRGCVIRGLELNVGLVNFTVVTNIGVGIRAVSAQVFSRSGRTVDTVITDGGGQFSTEVPGVNVLGLEVELTSNSPDVEGISGRGETNGGHLLGFVVGESSSSEK